MCYLVLWYRWSTQSLLPTQTGFADTPPARPFSLCPPFPPSPRHPHNTFHTRHSLHTPPTLFTLPTHIPHLPSSQDFSLTDSQLGGGNYPDLRVTYVSQLLSAWTGLRRLELVGRADMVSGVGAGEQ